jgi:hypothetical protein
MTTCAGLPQHVHVFDYGGYGALTVVATLSTNILTWLDAALDAAPIKTQVVSAGITCFAAHPHAASEGPGFVGILTAGDGSVVIVLSGQGRVIARQLERDEVIVRPRGYLQVLGQVVQKQEASSWMARMAPTTSGYGWLEATMSKLTTVKSRPMAPEEAAVHGLVLQSVRLHVPLYWCPRCSSGLFQSCGSCVQCLK